VPFTPMRYGDTIFCDAVSIFGSTISIMSMMLNLSMEFQHWQRVLNLFAIQFQLLAMCFQQWNLNFCDTVSIFVEIISTLALRFQLWHCDFNYGNVISTWSLWFQCWHCDFNFGIAISTLDLWFIKPRSHLINLILTCLHTYLNTYMQPYFCF
jgi:hypothetical protein